MSANPADGESPGRTATQDSLLLRKVFQSINAQSCPTTYNFHMHTNCSDGKLEPSELMAQAVEIGLHGMAITDHHSVGGYRKACQWMEDWRWHNPSSWGHRQRRKVKGASRHKKGKSGSREQKVSDSAPQPARYIQKKLPKLWTGIEITSRLAETDVHILGYAFEPAADAMRPYVQGSAPKGEDRRADRVIRAIQAAGGIAVLAHPVRYRTDEITLIKAAAGLGIDGVETYYAYNNPNVWKPSPGKTERVAALATANNLLSSCGTDTHGKMITRRL